MKKNLILVLLSIVIVIQFIILYNTNQTKTTNNSSKSESEEKNKTEEPNKNIELYYSYLMNNPIDNYYSSKFNNPICEVELRDNLEEYQVIWKKEYYKVINLIKKKCIYDIDRENLDNFDRNVENLIEAATPTVEAEILDVYNEDPDVPENRGWGNSTYYALQATKGQIYRDACMLLIPYLEGEYEFTIPTENDLE